MSSPKKKCQHNWQKFKQSINPTNPKYTGGRAYFIIRACLECKQKQVIEYIKE